MEEYAAKTSGQGTQKSLKTRIRKKGVIAQVEGSSSGGPVQSGPGHQRNQQPKKGKGGSGSSRRKRPRGKGEK